jgi:hypothetical protein
VAAIPQPLRLRKKCICCFNIRKYRSGLAHGFSIILYFQEYIYLYSIYCIYIYIICNRNRYIYIYMYTYVDVYVDNQHPSC